ncbi:MAG: acetylxylan esterase [Lacisediminihabitans sp.]
MLNDWPLDEARAYGATTRCEVVDTSLKLIDTYDVTFAGYGGHEVRGWLRLPAGAHEPLPAVAAEAV